jgi:hypothetical protein
MSFNNGDVVRIGKGKVEYTVRGINVDGSVNVESNNTNRVQPVDPAKLTLIHSDFVSDAEIETEIAEQADPRDDDTDTMPVRTTEHPMAAWEVELLFSDKLNPKRPYLLTVDHVTTDHKSYGAACDALIVASRQGFKHYAVIDQGGKRLATRTAV